MMAGEIREPSRRDDKRVLHPQIGLWALASNSSLRHALKKVRRLLVAGFCCHGFDHERMGVEASLVDAYFSIPVVSAATPIPTSPSVP